ncbi:response regulator [Psychrobacter immobilis]|uniref:response regulator n=1 Tax=Psychrobacter immobilis TaxID=498 RepID=UPI0019187FCB|nr:response regulator [Psychrobacter immobilis]
MTTVLVIDDSPSEMAKFRDMLSKNNYQVLEATNGEQGCQMAIDHLPDVILMDVVMPEMNGFQATRKITRGKTTAHIPIIIMISTKNQETDRVWGKRQGAKEYITKPIDESGLVQIIRKVMG